ARIDALDHDVAPAGGLDALRLLAKPEKRDLAVEPAGHGRFGGGDVLLEVRERFGRELHILLGEGRWRRHRGQGQDGAGKQRDSSVSAKDEAVGGEIVEQGYACDRDQVGGYRVEAAGAGE